MSHLLNLDLLSLSISLKDAFYVALAVLVSASQVLESKVFPSLDRSLKSNMEISSKLDAKKQATQQLSALGIKYDAHKEHIRVLIEELEMEKAKLKLFSGTR